MTCYCERQADLKFIPRRTSDFGSTLAGAVPEVPVLFRRISTSRPMGLRLHQDTRVPWRCFAITPLERTLAWRPIQILVCIAQRRSDRDGTNVHAGVEKKKGTQPGVPLLMVVAPIGFLILDLAQGSNQKHVLHRIILRHFNFLAALREFTASVVAGYPDL